MKRHCKPLQSIDGTTSKDVPRCGNLITLLIPLLMTQHTNIAGECKEQIIQELSERADNEYYMSAGSASLTTLKRAQHGLITISTLLYELAALEATVKCPACLSEIERQLNLQRDAIREIQAVWKME